MRWVDSAVRIPSALLSSCAVVLLVVSGCTQAPAPVPTVPKHWPTASWDTASPESEGIDSGVLLDLLAFATHDDLGVHNILIVRRGRLVFDAGFYPYDGETPHDVASVTKSVTTTLLGAAIHEGKLNRLDRPIAALLHRDGPSLDRAKSEITLGLGFDGRYRITPTGPRGYAVGLRGAWRAPNALDVDYVEPAGSNAFTLDAEFEADRVRLSVRDRTGLYGEHVILGRVPER